MTRDELRREVNRLNRVYGRLFKRVGFGWDMATLAVCEPGVYNSYRRLAEVARPIRERCEAIGAD